MTKEKKNKPFKELPLGFVDRQEKELLVRDFIISNIKEVMIKYGFQYLETPSFEYSDSIGKFLPDKDRPDEGVFSFKDENKWLSLRYDLTAPLARYVAKNYLEESKENVLSDVILMSVGLNRASGFYYSNQSRFLQIMKSEKILRRIDDVYLIDSLGNILISDVFNR